MVLNVNSILSAKKIKHFKKVIEALGDKKPDAIAITETKFKACDPRVMTCKGTKMKQKNEKLDENYINEAGCLEVESIEIVGYFAYYYNGLPMQGGVMWLISKDWCKERAQFCATYFEALDDKIPILCEQYVETLFLKCISKKKKT